MADVLRSLDEITTGFNIFEKNQVLTHDQLNRLGSYLDDQERLTRVGGIGAGVGCGLRPSTVDRKVRITKGVGLTTDGDLFRFGADVFYDRFKPYDEAAPVYAPFFAGTTRMPLFELIKVGDKDARAMGLENFDGRTGFALESMAAVLYMESYVRDPDLCSGTDCDNLGKDALNTVRVLLTDRRSAARLRAPFDTPDMAARDLDAIAAERPIMKPDADTPRTVSDAYLTACKNTLAGLETALAKIFPRCSAFLAGVFAQDPAPGWIRVLDGLQAQFTAAPRGVQYYYDFLVDLVDTYTDFKMSMYGDTTLCAADLAGFPKHLLLGVLARGDTTAALRTPFFASPTVAAGMDRRRHTRFLARKIDALIGTFELPTLPIPVRVTPSQTEDRRLEDRAIPHYYKVTDIRPIHRAWNYRLEEADMSAFNYSYNALSYGAQGAAANPLASPIAPFTLFRIEGHLGRSVEEALALINREIQTFNLPITARAVMLDPDRRKLPWRLPFRFTDLHRLHYLWRNDLAAQLDEAGSFGGQFRNEVSRAVDAKTVIDDSDASDSTTVKALADQKAAAVKGGADRASAVLSRPFAAYIADTSWKTDLDTTTESAAQFKVNLSKVVKTEFSTPFDNLIASPHIRVLPWLEDLIKWKHEKEETRVLFSTFLTEHRGLEHRAGVPAGGTFVLAHDTQGIVVADFSLPYYAPAPVEEPEDVPPLVKPIRPPFLIDKGIRVQPSREKLIADKLDDFKVKLQPDLNRAIDFQARYLDGFKDVFTLVGPGLAAAPKPGAAAPGTRVQDPVLDSHLKDTRAKVETVDFIRKQLLDPSNDPGRQGVLEDQLKTAEAAVADSVATTSKYLSDSAVDVSAGSDGNIAMSAVSDAMNHLNDRNALNTVKNALNDAGAAATAKPELKNVFAGLLKQKGLGR